MVVLVQTHTCIAVALLAALLAAPAAALPPAIGLVPGAPSEATSEPTSNPTSAPPAAQGMPQPRASLTGSYLTPCLGCQDAELPGFGTFDGTLVSSISFANGYDPNTNGVDGYWFDIAGAAGQEFTLDDAGAAATAKPWPQDIRFFAGPADTEDMQLGGSDSAAMPKTGTVPAGANFAFVYARWPSGDAVWPAVPRLTIGGGGGLPGAPGPITAVPAEGSVDLSWAPPAGDAAVDGYTVHWGTASGAYSDSLFVAQAAATIGGLMGDVPHYFAVEAENSLGVGPLSVEAMATPLGADRVAPSFTSPVAGSEVRADVVLTGMYTQGLGGSAFDNTHYLFLLNLNGPCGDPLGYGDHVIAAALANHATTALGVPAANVRVLNQDGGALARSVDPAHYDQLPPAWRSGAAFDGPASRDAFRAAINAAAHLAAAGEAANGAPARLVVLTSSHGFHNPGNGISDDGAVGDRWTSSAMCLYPRDRVSDTAFGAAVNDALLSAEAAHGVTVEMAALVDCSFCGGFADRPVQGASTTGWESAGLVGPNRVVEVGCSWVTECFGNPASTYYHMFTRCAFGGLADGYGPAAGDAPAGNPAHHLPDGLVTVEEAFWCAQESARSASGHEWAATDPQQMYQIDDQLAQDLFRDPGFVIWDVGADQALAGRDWAVPVTTAADPGPAESIMLLLAGPAGATVSGQATLSPADGSWSFDPAGSLAPGDWTATVQQAKFGRPVGPSASIGFTVIFEDSDGDGVPDGTDLCPGFDDAADLDGDGLPDACDDDRDGDGQPNGGDAFPDDSSEWSDADGDGVGDNADKCKGHDDALDRDGDRKPDGCDNDRDGDGHPNEKERRHGSDPDDPASVPRA
jgi:hypothetical protein